MAKKIKKKKKFKGTRYVANVLKRYFKKKYPTYQSALPKAREVAQQLRDSGLRFTVKNVELLVRKHRPPKPPKQKPHLYYKLAGLSPYFELIDYAGYIKLTTDEIFFISDLFNVGVDEIQGGEKPSYKESFSGYVQFVNKEVEDGEYESKYLVTCTPPEFNNENQRWESKIISTDSDGEEVDYGYEAVTDLVNFEPKTSKSKKQPKAKPEKLQAPTETDKEIELKRQENMQLAMKLFLNKDISKQEYKEMVAMINSK
jgi:hypothetical protein